MRFLRWGAAALGGVLMMVGCGGSGSSSSTTTMASPRVTIAWPAQTRDFSAPTSALSAVVVLEQAMPDRTDFSFQVNRPTGPAASIQTYTAPSVVRAGTYLLRMYFQPTTDTFGDPVGVVSATVRVAADGSLRRPDGSPLGDIQFTSTIRSVNVLDNQSVDAGETKELAVEVISTTGTLLVVPPGSIRLEVTNGSQFLRANPDGTVAGLAEGAAFVAASIDGQVGGSSQVLVRGAGLPSRSVELRTNLLKVDPIRGRIWATLPSSAANGNSLVDIDPAAGTIGNPIFVGSEPGPLGISGDASTAYVGVSGARAVRRVDLNTRTAGLQFYPRSVHDDPTTAYDIAVQPGGNDTIALTSDGGSYGPTIYDNGVRRPNGLGIYEGTVLVWTSPSRIVTFNSEHTGAELIEVNVDANGATKGFVQSDGLGAFTRSLVRAGNRLYGGDGSVVDENTLNRVGRFTFDAELNDVFGPAVDTDAGLAFFLEVRNGEAKIHAYRLDTFLKVATRRVKDVSLPQFPFEMGNPSLTRWGAKGLAFRTPERVYFVDQVPGL